MPPPLFEIAMSLDARFHNTLAETIAGVQERLGTEFRSVFADATADAERERTAALAAAEEARAVAVSEARSATLAELQATFEAEKAELGAAHEHALAQAAEAARAELARLTDAAVADAQRVRQDAEEAKAHVKADADATVEAIRAELRSAQDAALRQREEFESTFSRLQSEHDTRLGQLRAEHDAAMAELRATLETMTQARDEEAAEAGRLRDGAEAVVEGVQARMRDEFEATTVEARQLAESALSALRAEASEAAMLHSQAVDAHQTGSLRLLEAVRTLDGATALADVLDALTAGVSREAGRAAMLVVKNERLVGWRTIGFGAFDHDARTIESSTDDTGALAAAVNTGRPAVVGSGSVFTAPAFSEAPPDRPGLAVPLLVAGRPVAVLYADPGTASPSLGWTSPVEVLVRHAARCLEGLAVQRATASRASGARAGAPA